MIQKQAYNSSYSTIISGTNGERDVFSCSKKLKMCHNLPSWSVRAAVVFSTAYYVIWCKNLMTACTINWDRWAVSSAGSPLPTFFFPLLNKEQSIQGAILLRSFCKKHRTSMRGTHSTNKPEHHYCKGTCHKCQKWWWLYIIILLWWVYMLVRNKGCLWQ